MSTSQIKSIRKLSNKLLNNPNGFTTANQFLEDQQHINNCIRVVPVAHRKAVLDKYNDFYLHGYQKGVVDRFAVRGASRRNANLFLFAVKAKAEGLNHAY